MDNDKQHIMEARAEALLENIRNQMALDNQSFEQMRAPPNITWHHIWPLYECQEAIRESLFAKVPIEVFTQIFRTLSVRDLGSVSLVCRTFKMVADQDSIWKVKCNIMTQLQSKSYKLIYMEWMYEKYLRNAELVKIESLYQMEQRRVACGLCGPGPAYPVRNKGNEQMAAPVGGFLEHPNTSFRLIVRLSVDLDKTAPALLDFLEKTSKYKDDLRKSAVLQQMITRYYRFMQLKAAHPANLLLVPTVDIEMIWQTHLLRPKMYRNDCQRLFHRIIDHSLISPNELEQFLKDQAFEDTRRLYMEKFGDEYCTPLSAAKKEEKSVRPKYEHHVFSPLRSLLPLHTYWDDTYYQFSSEINNTNYENPFSFTEADIILDGNWLGLCKQYMRDMLNKVDVDDYYVRHDDELRIDLSESAMMRLKKSYERFLYMATKYPSRDNNYQFIHPTYAIDIMWHAHMQEPLNYAKDCMQLVGYIVDHAPWPSVDEARIKHSCAKTDHLWKAEFQSNMDTDHLYNTIGERDSEQEWHNVDLD